MAENILQIENLSKHYHDGDKEIHAVDQLSLTIQQGEFISLSGSSGSGKTTLLNLIGGLETPDGGQLILDGEDVANLSRGEKTDLRLNQIGFIFQAYNLIPVFSALENVAFILQMQGVAQQEAFARSEAMLQKVGLQGMESRRPNALSGGQQQRVAVARALVSNPSLVLADEPTANLDSENSDALMALLKHLNETQKTTFIISSHDPEVISFAPRKIVLKDGQLLSDSSGDL